MSSGQVINKRNMDIKPELQNLIETNAVMNHFMDVSNRRYFESFHTIQSIKKAVDATGGPAGTTRIKTEIINVEDDNLSAEGNSSDSNTVQIYNPPLNGSLRIHSTHIPHGGINFNDSTDLTEENISYGEKANIISANSALMCDKCSFIAQTEKCLEIHMRIHSPLKQCTECDYIAPNRYQLRVHKKQSHPGASPYKCDECDYSSRQKIHLVQHAISHTGDKPFMCENCDFKTSKQILLNRHMKIHTGKNLFYCDSCDYKTNQKSGLLQHLRKHTGERPFNCSSCEYTARTAHQLKVHEMHNHSGESPYRCTTCGLKTGDKTKLTVHMRIHTGEKPYVCDLCGYKLTQKSSLVRHKKTHEGVKKGSAKKAKQKRVPFEQVFCVTKVEPDSST